MRRELRLDEGEGIRVIGYRLMLVMNGDIIRVKEELRRAAITAVVILADQRGARATTLGAFQSFDVLGHTGDELCEEL